MWMAADNFDRFVDAAPPGWVKEWLSRRRAKPAGENFRSS
jgi:hypothetical protein